MPASEACLGLANFTTSLSTFISPLVAGCTPDKTLINVDLPAPLSPSKA